MQNYLSFSKLFEICKSDELWQMGHPTIHTTTKNPASAAGSNITSILLIILPFLPPFREHWFNNHHCKGCGLTFQNETFLSKHKSRSEKCNELPENNLSLNSRENTSIHQALVKATSETPRYKRNRFVCLYFLQFVYIFGICLHFLSICLHFCSTVCLLFSVKETSCVELNWVIDVQIAPM